MPRIICIVVQYWKNSLKPRVAEWYRNYFCHILHCMRYSCFNRSNGQLEKINRCVIMLVIKTNLGRKGFISVSSWRTRAPVKLNRHSYRVTRSPFALFLPRLCASVFVLSLHLFIKQKSALWRRFVIALI